MKPISIIVPCYNGARYLPQLAACLHNVTEDVAEVVFVDDGSSDGSFDIFRELVPDAICIRQQNQGLGRTRNVAVSHASGEFLQLLDADDTIEVGKLTTQLEAATRARADVVYSDWRMVITGETRSTHHEWQGGRPPSEMIEALLGGLWWFPPHAPLVRRTAFEAIGGCRHDLGNTCEDFDLWVRLAIAQCRFEYVPGNFANYHRDLRVRSMSRIDPREFLEGEARIIRDAVALLRESAQATRPRLCAAATRMYAVARNAYKVDPRWHRRLIEEVHGLDPAFQPRGSWVFRTACALLGYSGAERIASTKLRIRGHFQAFGLRHC